MGSIVSPKEDYYLIAEDVEALESVINRAAKIGYETSIKGALLNPVNGTQIHPEINVDALMSYPENFTIVDVRSTAEVNAGDPYFDNIIAVPLHELRERAHEIPVDNPIVVHCEGGYRSAAGSSILESIIPGIPVYDLGEAIKQFKPVTVN